MGCSEAAGSQGGMAGNVCCLRGTREYLQVLGTRSLVTQMAGHPNSNCGNLSRIAAVHALQHVIKDNLGPEFHQWTR